MTVEELREVVFIQLEANVDLDEMCAVHLLIVEGPYSSNAVLFTRLKRSDRGNR